MESSEPFLSPGRRFVARRGVRRACVVFIVLGLVWSAAWFYVPPIVASEAEKAVAQKLGRRLTLGHVAFNPWTLELTIDDLALAGANDGAPAQVQVKRIHADASISSLFRFAPVIDSLDIEAPMLRLTRLGDGRYDVDDVLRRLAAAPADQGDAAPARFAVHNIVVRAGAVDFADTPVHATHRIRDLELGVPFLSTLPSEREVKVEPHLAFELDGSRFDSAAAATPWYKRGEGKAKLHLDRFDIAPYFVYLPQGLPARPQSALVSADLLLAFERRPRLALRISGTVEVDAIKVVDAASQELLQAGSVKVAIDDLRPLESVLRLSRIDVVAPHVLAVRNAAGRVNLLLAAGDSAGETVPVVRVPLPTTAASAAQDIAPKVASAPSPGASGAPANAAAPRWKATLAALSIRAGQLDWRDATTAPPAALALTDFSLDAQAIGWPLDAPVVFKGQGVLGTAREHGKLAFSGQGNAGGAAVQIELDALPLAAAQAYLRGVLAPALVGDLSADLGIEWRPEATGPQFKVDARRVVLASLALGDAKAPEVAAEQIEMLVAHVDTAARSATIGRLALRAPRLRVDRDAAGHWNFDRWPSGAASASAAAPAIAGGWKLALGDLAIEQGRAGLTDRSLGEPVALNVSDLAVQVRGWALDASSAAPFRVTAHLAVPAGPTGKAVSSGVVGSVDVRGELKTFADGLPASAKAKLLLKDLPLHLIDPYLDAFLDIDVQKAQTSFKGDVAWERRRAGPSLRLRGDATIDDFRAASVTSDRGAPRHALAMLRDASSSRQLLNWKSLSMRGIDVTLAPGTAPRVAIAETALSDFFARIVLDENGRLNLQDVARRPARDSPPVAAAAASAAVVASASSGPAAIFEFGPIAVVNGRVNYNDRFVKPNYTADLSELNGRLGAFSSQPASAGAPPQLADLELRGRAEGTASLEITGKVNPLAKPLALDLRAKVRDLELPPLSPYAIKYSGYGIERGKMSVDLAYLVKPDGQLTASNKIVLNQLAFGDRVEGSTASLPVKLAIALLADRHGVIDLDLPVGGSINDPQFSLGGVIWKLITNLVLKAVTAPFNLLASAFGGSGSELSSVEFAPGTAVLGPAAKERLDKVAKALVERPALSLTVTGESRLESEKEAWKRDRLQQIVRSEKRRQAIAGGASPSAEVTLDAAEYPALLKEVYRRADIVKPKNIVGLPKDLPTDEMQALLLASITVADDAMQQLAVRRAVAVRDYLATQDLPTSRLFLGAPKTAPDDAAWTPRADLKLAIE